MKDINIYIGSGSSVILAKLGMGKIDIHLFSWWELLLIAFFFWGVAIFGGFVGVAFKELTQKIKDAWIGKKKVQRPYS